MAETVKRSSCDAMVHEPLSVMGESDLSFRPSDLIPSEALIHHREATNEVNLLDKLLGDVFVGVGVTAAIAPCLTAVDKALVQCAACPNTSFSGSVVESLRGMVHHPIQYLKSPTFLWMWATYAATYATANCFNTLSDENKSRRNHSQPARHQKLSVEPPTFAAFMFVGTTFANSTAALCKDRAYARMFGADVKSVPSLSYGLWLARDFTVIGSSFLLPPVVARYMDQMAGHDEEGAAPSARSLAVAQFVTPVAAQTIAGPLHYVGLDVCNRPTNVSWQERWVHLKGGLSSVIPARMIRILPGYGMGGVWNQHGRRAWNDYLQRPQRPLWRRYSQKHHHETQSPNVL